MSRFQTNKILHPSQLAETCAKLKSEGKTIATLNGSFDLFHAGHLTIIEEAAKQADLLIIALNSDQSIQQYKSASRPIVPLEYRLKLIAALESVDFVTWFDETDPIALLTTIKPHVHVNGADYGENCIEAETVKKFGGRLHLASLVPGLSTTTLVKRIKDVCG